MTAARRLLLLLTGINLVNYLDRYVVAAVIEPLGRDLGLSDTQRGWVNGVFLLAYMVGAPLFGMLADRFHRPRLVAVGVALWSLATAGACLVHGFWGLLFTRSLVGVGEAAYASLGPALLADLFPEDERAAKFTWFYLAIPVGSAMGYALGGIVAQHWGWRQAFLVAGLPGLFFAARMATLADPPRGGQDQGADSAVGLSYGMRLRAILTNRVWVACTGSYVAYTFAMGALSFWGSAFLQRRHGVSVGSAGEVFGIFLVVTGILGTFAGGLLTKRLQHRWPDIGVDLSAVTLLLAIPAVFWALSSGNLQATYLAFFAAMLMLFVNTSPVNALTVSCLPASVRATGTGINVLLIHLLGDALSPALVGRISEAGGAGGVALGRALLLVIPAIAVSAVALLWARRRPVLA